MTSTIESSILACMANPRRDTYVQVLAMLAARWRGQSQAHSGEGEQLEQLAGRVAQFESAWALALACLAWREPDRRTPAAFLNAWQFARFAGNSGRFSRLNAASQLELSKAMWQDCASPAASIWYANALRQQRQFSAASDVLLDGIARFPNDPFIKFRLADLMLATGQAEAAQRLLRQLRPHFPFAREMMFITDIASPAPPGPDLFQSLDAGAAGIVCFAAADPVYMERYAPLYVQSMQRLAPQAHLHLHIIRDVQASLPQGVVAALAPHAARLTLTQRSTSMEGRDRQWQKAFFASERFLLLAEMLKKYQRPIFVTDIDIELLRDPATLLPLLSGQDFLHTGFNDSNEAWERYAGAAFLVAPTATSILFFEKMAQMLMALLNGHAQPWFADQIALFRLIEGGDIPCRIQYVHNLFSDAATPPADAYFRTLHADWQTPSH